MIGQRYVLRRDVQTAWGVFSRGLPVHVLEFRGGDALVSLQPMLPQPLQQWMPESNVGGVPA